MHHSGSSIDLNEKFYVDGKVNYFDVCDSNEMTVSELHDMTWFCGLENLFCMYYSNEGPDDSNSLVLISSDIDAKNLIRFVDSERVIGIFVECVDTHVGCLSYRIPIDVRVESVDMGYNVDADNHHPEVESEEGDGNQKNDKTHAYASQQDEIIELECHSDSSSSDEEDNDYDSDYSDDFEDSDFEHDDMFYDENIDNDIEWVGERDEPVDALVGKKIMEQHFINSMVRGLKQSSTKRSEVKSSHITVYEDNADDSDFEFEVSLCFKSADEFREAVRKYSNKQGKPVKFVKNCRDKIQVKCKCGWVIYASFISKRNETFQVKSIKGKHTCQREANSKHCTSKFLARKYQHYLRSNPEWPVLSMLEIMQMENQTELSIWKMYRAEQQATILNHGTELEQYSKLWEYCEELRRTNVGTTIKIKCRHVLGAETRTFKKLYICWGATKRDGTHLKTSRGGVLLKAIDVDGNNSMYPIANAMVLKETRKSWEWFVSILIEDLDMGNSHAWTIMSDKQKGLIKAIQNLLPNAEHRFCVRHMYNNFKKKHKGLQLKELVWKAASSTRMTDFTRVMDQLKSVDQKAYDWLRERPPMQWSKSHFSCWSKCDMLLNNLCESFNNVIMKARNKSIITIIEIIRVVMMRIMYTQRDKVLKSDGDICPAIQKQLEDNKKKAFNYVPEYNGTNMFEVRGWLGDQWVVDLSNKICSCRKWELTGIPCVHATSCIFKMRQRVEDYVEHWYRKDTFVKAYQCLFEPIKGQGEWPKPQTGILPIGPWPEKPKKAGRPQLHKRRLEPDELIQQKEDKKKLKRKGLKYACSNCGATGHNKKSCKEPKKREKLGASVKFILLYLIRNYYQLFL
ncbi:hypothetical protein ACJIZ3_023409 [Penstemon smallii]|uniref:SWIM-type domain-containing protein n=1 Tax=Penstemon smallii TaxID=265156 RepID=A0ABD3TRX5_9LAMI